LLPAVAVIAQPVPPGVRACVSEADAGRRLACFDAAVAEAMKNESSGQSQLGEEQLHNAPAEQARAAKARPLEAVLVSVSQRPRDGGVVVTLDNGQVWEQSEPGPDLRLKPGDPVTVRRGLLGAYWLTGRSRVSIKVHRTR
jgi:hypothetical protein